VLQRIKITITVIIRCNLDMVRNIDTFCQVRKFTVFTKATNVNHANGISRHRLMPYDVPSLNYKL